MNGTARASGVAGLGFVTLLVVANLVLISAGIPLPTDDPPLGAVAETYAQQGAALRAASALMPAAWLLATVFAAGLAVSAWDPASSSRRTWALVGLAGVVLQCAVFTGAEAARLALGAAATDGPAAVAGLWGLHRALFGYNQVFLATALLGFSLSVPVARWHAALGLTGAALLLVSGSLAPYGVGQAHPLAAVGLVGWLLWLAWITVAGVRLLRTPRGTRTRDDVGAAARPA